MIKLVVLTIILVLSLDQLTKQLITNTMEIGDSNPIINNFLYITYHRNTGAAFGLFEGQMIFFYIVTTIAVILVFVWLTKINIKKEKVLAIALALILSGALGNFIDRVRYQSVIDFIHTVWWGNSFPIFNIADMALTIGAVLVLFDMLILDRKRSKDLYFKMD